MYLLSIDTSTRFCSVALHQDGKELCAIHLLAERSSSSLLTSVLEAAVDFAGISLADIDAFAVAEGPGSYTGLRVSVSTVKGLCFALDKPLIAVSTLQAMALQVKKMAADVYPNPESLLFVPMIDARRMEVYCALYDYQLKVVRQVQPVIIEAGCFGEELETHRVVFLGDGAPKCRPVLGAHPNAVFLEQEIVPLATTVGEIASDRYREKQFEDLAGFEPNYLKEFHLKRK